MDYIAPLGISFDAWSEWSPLARGLALAWQQEQKVTCSRCGTRQDEWENDGDAYMGATHHCRGCELIGQQQGVLPTDEDGRPMPGYVPYLLPREQAMARLEAEAARQEAQDAAARRR